MSGAAALPGADFLKNFHVFWGGEVTCLGQLRCLGQTFSRSSFSVKKSLVRGSCAAWGRPVSRNLFFVEVYNVTNLKECTFRNSGTAALGPGLSRAPAQAGPGPRPKLGPDPSQAHAQTGPRPKFEAVPNLAPFGSLRYHIWLDLVRRGSVFGSVWFAAVLYLARFGSLRFHIWLGLARCGSVFGRIHRMVIWGVKARFYFENKWFLHNAEFVTRFTGWGCWGVRARFYFETYGFCKI